MGSFALDVGKFARKYEANMEVIGKKLLFEISGSLVAMSPVDTGRFRANWQFGVGSAPGGNLYEMPTKGEPRGEQNFPDDGATTGRLQSQISDSKMLGNVHYLANNLPYAQRLEDGWSKQAPAGMVKITVTRFEAFVSAAVAGVKQ